MLGVAMLLGIVALLMNVMGSPAHADEVALKGNDIVNPINTVWTLVAAFLVFGMKPGFTMLEAGRTGARVLRHLGHAVPRALRVRTVRLDRPDGSRQLGALTGLFYGGGFTVLTAQVIGSAAICISVLVTTLIMMYAIHAFGLLRVSTAGELQGLDLHEHGVPAYPEYALHGSAAPQGAPEFMAAAYGAEARVAMGSQKMAKS